jgi:hypothetical protein
LIVSWKADGYRLKKGVDIWEFAADVKARAQDEIRQKLHALCERLLCSPAGCAAVRADLGLGENDEVRFEECCRYVRKRYFAQLGNIEINDYDFSTSLAIRRHDGRYYVRAHAGWAVRDVLDFLRNDARLEDFSYNTIYGRPDDVSKEEWSHREQVWRALDAAWDVYLNVEICCMHNYHKVDPLGTACRQEPSPR